MKYRLISGLILAFFLVTEFSHGQDLTVEEYWMNCVYSSYEDEGAAIRSTLLNFENLLIEEGVLKNNKAASYKKLLEKMAEGQIEQTDSRSSMIKELVAVEKNADNSLLFSCQGSLKEHPDHSAVIQSKDDMITKLITEDNLSMQTYAQGLLEVNKGQSFDSQYVKLLIMIAFDLDLVMGG